MKRTRCTNGTRKNRNSGNCEKPIIVQPRCKNGYRKNRKTKECQDKTIKKLDMKIIKRLSKKKINSIINNELIIKDNIDIDNSKNKLKNMLFPSNTYFKGIKTFNDALKVSVNNVLPYSSSTHSSSTPSSTPSSSLLEYTFPSSSTPINTIYSPNNEEEINSPINVTNYDNIGLTPTNIKSPQFKEYDI